VQCSHHALTVEIDGCLHDCSEQLSSQQHSAHSSKPFLRVLTTLRRNRTGLPFPSSTPTQLIVSGSQITSSSVPRKDQTTSVDSELRAWQARWICDATKRRRDTGPGEFECLDQHCLTFMSSCASTAVHLKIQSVNTFPRMYRNLSSQK
jgi:hypothetical protein